MEGVSKSVLADNFMTGMNNLLDAVYHPGEYGAAYVRNFVSTLMPWSVGQGQVARMIDPYPHDVRSILDSARSKIPVESEGLFPQVDMFGQPISRNEDTQKNANDPAIRRLDALGYGPGKLSRDIRGVPLTQQQYYEYSTLAGRKFKLHLDNMVKQPSFAQLPQATQIDHIYKALTKARHDAQTVMLTNYHDLVVQAHEKKVSRRSHGAGTPITP